MTNLDSLLKDLGIPEHAKELIREAVRKDNERNQCDGCQRGLPVDAMGFHREGHRAVMVCQKERYAAHKDV